jgi:hypothetical protein
MTRGLTILQVDEALYSSGDMAAIGNALEERTLSICSEVFLSCSWRRDGWYFGFL